MLFTEILNIIIFVIIKGTLTAEENVVNLEK